MEKSIEYVILVILFIITFFTIFQLRSKVADLETANELSSVSSIADIQSSATTALATANSATTTANTALSTANSISATANTALTNSNTATTTANTVNSAQTAFAEGFVTDRVIPTFALSSSFANVSTVDPDGGYLRFNPSPSGKMSFQLILTTASGHENDPNAYFDITTPYNCTMFGDWAFFASSTFADSDIDEIVQSKVSQTSSNTFRAKMVLNGMTTNYARLSINGIWST